MKMTSNIEHKIDSALKKKYDLVAERISNTKDKNDALILFEGDEGEGKSNHAVCFCDYIAQKTGREFYNSNVYFDVTNLIEIAKNTKGKIFLWDEPSLQGLRKQWWNKAQIQLTQLLMMARKNRHLFVFCITDFTEFNKYIIRRAKFMLRIYRRRESEHKRRFLYFPRKYLRIMFDVWNSRRKRMYNKYKTLHGTMNEGYLLPEIINEEQYELDKDNAIKSIGEELKNGGSDRYKEEWNKSLQHIIDNKYPITITCASDACRKILNKNPNLLSDFKTRMKNLKKNEIPKIDFSKFAPSIIVKGTTDEDSGGVVPNVVPNLQ